MVRKCEDVDVTSLPPGDSHEFPALGQHELQISRADGVRNLGGQQTKKIQDSAKMCKVDSSVETLETS